MSRTKAPRVTGVAKGYRQEARVMRDVLAAVVSKYGDEAGRVVLSVSDLEAIEGSKLTVRQGETTMTLLLEEDDAEAQSEAAAN